MENVLRDHNNTFKLCDFGSCTVNITKPDTPRTWRELQLLEELRAARPLLLLDDVFSELDGARRQALTRAMKGYQTFITTTDADVVVQHFLGQCNIIAL